MRVYRRGLRTVAHRLLAAAGEDPSRSTRAGGVPDGRNKTVSEGWDAYARRPVRQGERLGDVWNDPVTMGIDVDSAEEVVPYLDRTVFGPFLGQCDVLLEIGAGGGRFTEVLLPRCRRLIAVDTSPAMLALLAERFPGDGRLECRLVDGQGLGLIGNECVDAAFSYGVFVHLQHWDIYRYLTELRRVLRPGGKALIQHSNVFSDLGWAKFRKEVEPQLNRHKLPWTFIPNTPDLMRELIVRAGLQCVEMNTEVVRRDCIALIRKDA
jgi:SAM-dependent methyltransferase